MTRNFILAFGLFTVAVSAAAATHKEAASKHVAVKHSESASNFTAAQLVNKNVAARGGLQAWRAVSTLSLSGQMEAGGVKNTELPFVMKMKRPHMDRLEIRFQDQTALQVYDGTQGWKLRPFLGRNTVEPFTPDEAKLASTWAELDGPLVDYARKGTTVALDGTESVEGHKTYKLKLTMKTGEDRHVWIDATSFLEAKIDGDPRKIDGRLHKVATYYRDYKAEKGLIMPHTLETVVEGVRQSHKMHIDQVAINQPMEDGLFTGTMLAMAQGPKQ